jgi:apolipoprotein D and lipocalin family protein
VLFFSCKTGNIITKDETNIDYKLYQGKWYEVARLPNPIEDGLTCITMTYEYHEEGVMTVTNKGQNKNDAQDIKTLSGRAWIPDVKEPKKIKIQFIWPVTRDYVLLHIDEIKGYAVLGSPAKHQLWILSRTPLVSEEDMLSLVKIAQKNEYNTDNLVRVDQNCKN